MTVNRAIPYGKDRLFSSASLMAVAWQLLLMISCFTDNTEGKIPSAPLNLTLARPQIYFNVAKISWSPGNPNDDLTDYIIVNRVEGSQTKTVTRIDPEYTSLTFDDLKAETKYVVYVQAAIGNDRSEVSKVLEFDTSKIEGLNRTFTTTTAELVIMFMVLAVWIGALSLFIRTWRKKMNGHVSPSSHSSGTSMRLRSRYRKPWMWSQKHRTDRGYSVT